MDIQEIIVHQVVLQGLVFAQHIPWKHKVRNLMKADSVPMASGLDCRVMVLSARIVLVLSRVAINHASKEVINHVALTSSAAAISHVSKAVISHVRVINHVSRVVISHVSKEAINHASKVVISHAHKVVTSLASKVVISHVSKAVTNHAEAISHAVVISHASKAASTRVVMVIVHAHRDMILMQNIA